MKRLALHISCILVPATLAFPGDRQVSKHLFFDRDQYENIQSITQTMNPPRKHDAAVMLPDRPWEQVNKTQITAYGTVLREAGGFKMWYQIYWLPVPFDRDKQRLVYGYATSHDGLEWDKPILGLKQYMGSTANNVLAGDDDHMCHGATVIADSHEVDPSRRYKLIAVPGYLGYSADGIHWRRVPKDETDLNPFTHDTHHVFFWDERAGHYRLYTRPGSGDRRIALATSPDCRTWKWHEPDNVVFAPDERDETACNIKGFYNMSVVPYHGLYIGLLAAYYHDETLDVQLAWSRDGVAWERCGDRRPFIPRGPKGSLDSGMIFPFSDIVRVGDDIRIYYSGHNYLHSLPDIQRPDAVASMTFATLRDDGFVSFDAGDTQGTFTTKPIRMCGDKLFVNAAASNGYVKVAILDDASVPMPGFASAEANPISGDGIRQEATWPRGHVRALGERMVRLKFRAKNAKVYSFWCE